MASESSRSRPAAFPSPFPGPFPDPQREAIAAGIQRETLLGRAATLADVGNVAAFLASDRARTLTATDVNISCGALMD
jgi:3-oxoacyl-[acyl-carrier protein] reductase